MKTIHELIKQSGTTLLDVRSPEEVAMGMAKNATNIPLQEIPYRMEEIKSMSQPIICYCRSGARSEQATQYLKSHGLEAYNAGGISDVYILQMN